jgi:hypothetical protein
VPQDLSAAASVKKHIVKIQVRKPANHWYVRCHPDPQYSFTAWVIDLKDEREQYLVLPEIHPHLKGEVTYKLMTFHLCVTMQGKVFLWPVRCHVDDKKEPPIWIKVPLEAVLVAKEEWTRFYWVEEINEHEFESVPNPIKPVWPNLTMRQVMELAFKNNIINSLDHSVLKRLRGEIA